MAYDALVNMMPISLTTSTKVMGHHACLQRPGVNRQGYYSCGARHLVSSLLSNFPACFKPYMPF